MQPKTERFEMRLDQATLENLDTWRSRQGDLPSRAEAVRRLIEIGQAPSQDKGMNINDGEKLILHMLCEVYKHLNIKGELDPDFIARALYGGHYWGLTWKYTGIFHGHQDSNHVVSEVADVLDMWSFIESGYDKLSAKDRSRIETEAEPFGKHVSFRGFDGNSEAEYNGVAHFLVNDLERFVIFKGRQFNSHMPSLDIYRRMFRVFEPMRSNLMGRELGANEIIAILNAKRAADFQGRKRA